MRPYVVRFVSQRSGVGKTLVASSVVETLIKAGYSVGVIKHSVSSISLEEKDSARYLRAGAPEVIVASKELVLLYSKELVDDLDELLDYINKPMIVVEGFRDAHVGDTVVVSEDLEEAIKTINKDTIAIVLSKKPPDLGPHQVENIPVLYIDQIDELADSILRRAVDHFVVQLPGLDCGMCGLNYCRALALKMLKGEKRVCPVELNVKIIVDGRDIPLNPFVKGVVSSVIEGLLSPLKGVPRDLKRITIEITK